jgi:hypothetical protein
MNHEIPRRDFLKGATGRGRRHRARHPDSRTRGSRPPYPEIGSQPYTPADYPIHAKRFSEVEVTDSFWKPKIATNAEVTIPMEAQRIGAPGDGLTGNVLEAAIYSLETHPDAALQAQVDARIEALRQAMEERLRLNNTGYEVAVAWHIATGKRTLLDPAIKSAAALYEDFKVNHPPFSGG